MDNLTTAAAANGTGAGASFSVVKRRKFRIMRFIWPALVSLKEESLGL